MQYTSGAGYLLGLSTTQPWDYYGDEHFLLKFSDHAVIISKQAGWMGGWVDGEKTVELMMMTMMMTRSMDGKHGIKIRQGDDFMLIRV